MLMDRLKSFVTERKMEKAVFLSIFPDIPSDPEALPVSIARKGPSSSVQKMVSGGIVEGLTMNCFC